MPDFSFEELEKAKSVPPPEAGAVEQETPLEKALPAFEQQGLVSFTAQAGEPDALSALRINIKKLLALWKQDINEESFYRVVSNLRKKTLKYNEMAQLVETAIEHEKKSQERAVEEGIPLPEARKEEKKEEANVAKEEAEKAELAKAKEELAKKKEPVPKLSADEFDLKIEKLTESAQELASKEESSARGELTYRGKKIESRTASFPIVLQRAPTEHRANRIKVTVEPERILSLIADVDSTLKGQELLNVAAPIFERITKWINSALGSSPFFNLGEITIAPVKDAGKYQQIWADVIGKIRPAVEAYRGEAKKREKEKAKEEDISDRVVRGNKLDAFGNTIPASAWIQVGGKPEAHLTEYPEEVKKLLEFGGGFFQTPKYFFSLDAYTHVLRVIKRGRNSSLGGSMTTESDIAWAGPTLDQLAVLVGKPEVKWASELAAALSAKFDLEFPKFPVLASSLKSAAFSLPNTATVDFEDEEKGLIYSLVIRYSLEAMPDNAVKDAETAEGTVSTADASGNITSTRELTKDEIKVIEKEYEQVISEKFQEKVTEFIRESSFRPLSIKEAHCGHCGIKEEAAASDDRAAYMKRTQLWKVMQSLLKHDPKAVNDPIYQDMKKEYDSLAEAAERYVALPSEK